LTALFEDAFLADRRVADIEVAAVISAPDLIDGIRQIPVVTIHFRKVQRFVAAYLRTIPVVYVEITVSVHGAVEMETHVLHGTLAHLYGHDLRGIIAIDFQQLCFRGAHLQLAMAPQVGAVER